jgi:hypothetical protein
MTQQIKAGTAPVEVSWMEGSAVKVQEMRAVAYAKERRGEILRLGGPVAHPSKPGVLVLPYRRLRPEARWQSWKLRAFVLSGAGVVYGMSVLWLAWEARFVLLSLAGVLLLLWACTRFSHSGACVGLHGPGCRG